MSQILSRPEPAVQTAIAYRLDQMLLLDHCCILQIGNGSGHPQDAVVGAADNPKSSIAVCNSFIDCGVTAQWERS